MERKLSSKTHKMRHRLTFTRSTSTRECACPMIPSAEVSPSSSRPRSATNPESPTYGEDTMWDSIDASRCYNFTDEPGFFRPASPFLERQKIDEDLVLDIKHACALLSHSIDRGIPIGLSYQSAVPDWTDKKAAGKSTTQASSSFNLNALSSPGKPIKPATDTDEMHDSGVGMSFNSPQQTGRPYGNSVSSSRFYNKQSSISPPRSPTPARSRAESIIQTLADRGSIQPDYPLSLARSRSRSSSPVPFPYSPDQANDEWHSGQTTPPSPKLENPQMEKEQSTATVTVSETSPTASPTAISTPSETETSTPLSLGAEGQAWLRASKDLQLLAEEEKQKQKQKEQEQEKEKAAKKEPSNRFYSSNANATSQIFDSREWLTKNIWESRDPSLYDEASLSGYPNGEGRWGSMSTSGDSASRDGNPGQWWAGADAASSRNLSYSSSSYRVDEFKHQENAYSVVVPSLQPRRRRERAQLLLRKLAGFRRWRDGRVEA
ncbi:uncharacterized protein N7511_000353 [Penicillium nucicola]|uniref:uncharacterized protein n=1 Tax=Penicillium nucicola TaxID=1850975 RepID=UPI0025455168|nr:uncharacterized protein N7511_000353 [Penicillium nucicola]KAJ5775342.1 hypothetical protein N7511_000353 [Penicillium nucicola]